MTISWGIVATVKDTRSEVQKFVAHHLHLGADWIRVYFDDPDLAFPDIGEGLDRVETHICAPPHYESLGKRAHGNVRIRQTYNAGLAYRDALVDWLAHIDVDEFLLDDPRSELATVSEPYAQVLPCEALAKPKNDDSPHALIHAKRPVPNPRNAALLETLYPVWGRHLKSGLLSHRAGKTIVRTGHTNLRQRLHRVQINGQNVKDTPRLKSVGLLHMHAPSWDRFWHHFHYRLSIGGYRAEMDSETNKLHAILSLVFEEEGEAGVRAFFDELQLATPELLARLQAHDLYVPVQLDFDKTVRQFFGEAN